MKITNRKILRNAKSKTILSSHLAKKNSLSLAIQHALRGITAARLGSVVALSFAGFAAPALGQQAVVELSSLDGSNGFVLNGVTTLDLSGYSVSTAGDVNGDGVDDLLIGAEFAGNSGAR